MTIRLEPSTWSRPRPALLLPLLTVAFCAVGATPRAQDAPDSLRAIEREYGERQDRALADGRILSMEEFRALSEWLTTTLTDYLANTPRDDDRTAARLLLVGTLANAGNTEDATAALRALESKRASMLELLEAAEWAERFRDLERRERWIEAALARSAPFAVRMQAGMILMTRLLEVERAEQLFEAELAAAADDEGRAAVMWYQAAAVREREDRREGDYEAALGALATKLPKTEFGGIARDRLRAMAYEVGKPAVDLRGADLAGENHTLADLRGKVVLEFFWNSTDELSRRAFDEVLQLVERFAGRGFAVLSIGLDADRSTLETFARSHPAPWKTLFEPGGFESPLALRANVEHVPHLVLVDRNGDVFEPAMTLYDAEEVAHVSRRIEAALGPPPPQRDVK